MYYCLCKYMMCKYFSKYFINTKNCALLFRENLRKYHKSKLIMVQSKFQLQNINSYFIYFTLGVKYVWYVRFIQTLLLTLMGITAFSKSTPHGFVVCEPFPLICRFSCVGSKFLMYIILHYALPIDSGPSSQSARLAYVRRVMFSCV